MSDTPLAQCEGQCSRHGDCRGDVTRVHVAKPGGTDWGDWWYCETAIGYDRETGFEVVPAKVIADAAGRMEAGKGE